MTEEHGSWKLTPSGGRRWGVAAFIWVFASLIGALGVAFLPPAIRGEVDSGWFYLLPDGLRTPMAICIALVVIVGALAFAYTGVHAVVRSPFVEVARGPLEATFISIHLPADIWGVRSMNAWPGAPVDIILTRVRRPRPAVAFDRLALRCRDERVSNRTFRLVSDEDLEGLCAELRRRGFVVRSEVVYTREPAK